MPGFEPLKSNKRNIQRIQVPRMFITGYLLYSGKQVPGSYYREHISPRNFRSPDLSDSALPSSELWTSALAVSDPPTSWPQPAQYQIPQPLGLSPSNLLISLPRPSPYQILWPLGSPRNIRSSDLSASASAILDPLNSLHQPPQYPIL
jgi:hypothetical protein